MTKSEHKDWLDSLTLKERLIYDRAYGNAFYIKGQDTDQCRAAGKHAVEKGKHNG